MDARSPGQSSDPKLEGLLKERLLRSEGDDNSHCFIKPAAAVASPQDKSNGASSVRLPLPGVSPSAADVAAGSPHFSLETPPASPRERGHMSRSLAQEDDPSTEEGDRQPSSDEAEDEVQYEWQFDIMNHLPHEKAVSLMNLLKDSKRAKAQATAVAEQLQRKVSELEVSKRDDPPVESASAVELPAVSSRSSWSPLHLFFAFAAFLLAFAAGCLNHHVIDTSRWRGNQTASAQNETAPVSEDHAPGYRHIPHGCVGGHNLIKYPGKSVRDCAILCDASPACKAFEYSLGRGGIGLYKARDCQLQSGADPTGCDGSHFDLDLYIKASSDTEAVASSTQEVQPEPQEPQEPQAPAATVAAELLGPASLELKHPGLSQDTSVDADATEEMGSALAYFPQVTKVQRLGRVILHKDALGGGQAIVSALIYLGNTGTVTWPASTRLRLVVGYDMGISLLPIESEIPPGAHVELTLQFHMPTFESVGTLARSGWVLENGNEPFGPLLLLEVQVV